MCQRCKQHQKLTPESTETATMAYSRLRDPQISSFLLQDVLLHAPRCLKLSSSRLRCLAPCSKMSYSFAREANMLVPSLQSHCRLNPKSSYNL